MLGLWKRQSSRMRTGVMASMITPTLRSSGPCMNGDFLMSETNRPNAMSAPPDRSRCVP